MTKLSLRSPLNWLEIWYLVDSISNVVMWNQGVGQTTFKIFKISQNLWTCIFVSKMIRSAGFKWSTLMYSISLLSYEQNDVSCGIIGHLYHITKILWKMCVNTVDMVFWSYCVFWDTFWPSEHTSSWLFILVLQRWHDELQNEKKIIKIA